MTHTVEFAALPDDPFDIGDPSTDAESFPDPVSEPLPPQAPGFADEASFTEPVPAAESVPAVESRPPVISPVPSADSERLTPAQRVTFDELLAIGADRPFAPPGIVSELKERIASGTASAMATWADSLWFSKSQLSEAARCEGLTVANANATEADRNRPLHAATMTGIVAHRAIQISRTHPDEMPAHYVAESLRASRTEDRFGATWSELGDAERSDIQMAATSRVVSFLDSWPPLRDEWVWRFEESAQVRIGKLTLAARMDLVLGRPRADGRQTMLLCDLKTGSLGDQHELEASFYALVSALRWGVPPFRSMVYSLASGDWTDPDITAVRLRDTADAVVSAVNSRVAVLCEERAPVLTAGTWCRFCPARSTCPAAEDQPTS